MNELRKKTFKNGVVYCLQLEDGFLVETTDTFLPYYTKDAIGRHQNKLDNNELGDRTERWMIGVSTMSGCPVRCKFCATGNMKRYRNLTADEIVPRWNLQSAMLEVQILLRQRSSRLTTLVWANRSLILMRSRRPSVLLRRNTLTLIIMYQRLVLREAISHSLRGISLSR